MDIPKQPIPSSSSSVSASESISPVKSVLNANASSTQNQNLQRLPIGDLPSVSSNTVTLEELALPPGQQVIAKVIGELKENALIIGRDLNLPANDQQPAKLPSLPEALKQANLFQNMPADTPKQSTPRDWLIQVGRQFLVTKSGANLQSGKLLIITLNDNLTLSFSNPANIATQNQTNIVDVLRQAITRTLPQQTSLSSGFDTLTNTSQGRSAEAPQATQTQLLAKLITQLTKERIPSSEQLSQLYQSQQPLSSAQANTPSQIQDIQKVVESWLKNSGIAFEATQVAGQSRKNAAFTALETQATDLSSIWKALGHATSASPPSQEKMLRAANVMLNYIEAKETLKSQSGAGDSPSAITKLIQELTASKAPSAITETLQTYQGRLNALHRSADSIIQTFRSIENAPSILKNERIQTHFEQALTNYKAATEKAIMSISQLAGQLANHNLLNNQTEGRAANINSQFIFETALKQLPITQPAPSDLKALLQSVAHGLKASITETNSSASVDSAKLDLRGSLEAALLNKPFDFPQLHNSVLKAQAILADQELTTGQLLKLIAGMLNRIQFNQANSLLQAQANADTGLAQSWNMELPYLHEQQIHTLQLRIDHNPPKQRKSKKDDNEQQRSWTIELSFNFENIGPLHIKAELTPPHLKTEVWVANKEAEQLVSEEQEMFIHRLKEAGLDVEPPLCRVGEPERRHKAHIKQGLVDLHA